MPTGRIWIDWRLVCFAAMFAVAAPGQAVVAELPIVARIMFAVVGMLAWWYLFRCVADTLGRRILRQSLPVPVLAPWVLFTGSFYLHGLLLGLAWRGCRVGEPGFVLLHVLIGATVAGVAGAVTWGALLLWPKVRRTAVPVLGAVVVVVALLWPAMAVWHLVTGPAGGLCGPDGVPGWWPAILPLG